MRRILVYTLLLILGLICSQFLPLFASSSIEFILKQVTMVCLAFIMIHVGLEFRIHKHRLKEYGLDYLVAFVTATFPWIFCTLYFVYMIPKTPGVASYQTWTEALLLGRFAAPTSAGVLFTMLAAAGLASTWVFRKARILAIFDDLDTIILLIPLKMLIIGLKPELFVVVFFLLALLLFAWMYMHRVNIPLNWYWILFYSVLIVGSIEALYQFTKAMPGIVPIHLEVLLPAFVLGCVIAYPGFNTQEAKDLHVPIERSVHKSVSASFMFLVGLAMPPVFISTETLTLVKQLSIWETIKRLPEFLGYYGKIMTLKEILWHTLFITILSNLGKMFPAFCYKDHASLKERLALALGMCPRGEVGAGIIVVSLTLLKNDQNPMITIAMFSLALNLILTGPIIMLIKRLLISHKNKKIRDNETML